MSIFKIHSSIKNKRYTREEVLAELGFSEKTLKALIDMGVFPRPIQGTKKHQWDGLTLACWLHLAPGLNIVLPESKGKADSDDEED